jgi:hypothetical protein
MVIAGPMLAMTFVAFGEVGGANMQEAFLAKHPEIASRNNGICYIACPNALINFPATQLWVATTFRSFFAGLGWMNIWLPAEFYWGFFAPFTLVCFLMSVLFTIVPSDRDAPHLLPYFGRAFVALTWLMLLGTMLMSLLASQTIAPQAQGRYLFVVLPFVACSVGLVFANLQFALPANR